MNAFQVARLCAIFGLGRPQAEPQPVAGGFLHRLWRLETSEGTFAVKQLNPAIMNKPGVHENYLLTEEVARALAAAGIPAVAALVPSDGPLQEIGEITVMTYPWIEGEVVSAGAVEPERGQKIGAMLGRIHMLNLQFPGLPQPDWEAHPEDDWDMLTFHAADRSLPWAYQVRAALPKLQLWNKQAEEAGERLSHRLVVSHRDVDQKNVIWSADAVPWLIDWEAAGLINPSMEVVGVALAWSGQTVGEPRPDIFQTVIASYREAGGVLAEPALDVLHGIMGNWLHWLLFNMRRSFGESTSSEEERLLGVSETLATLNILRSVAENAEKWAGWVEKWGQE